MRQEFVGNLFNRSNVAAEIVNSLMLTPKLHRAALLAHAGVPNVPTLTGEEYMPALVELTDDTLHELQTAASWAASTGSTTRSSLDDEHRLQYFEQVDSLYKNVAADQTLGGSDKKHILSLISMLGDALREAPHQGDAPIEQAAKAIVGDAIINKDLWNRLASNKLVRRLGTLTAGLLLLLGSIGGYSDAKELATDVFPPPPAIASPKGQDDSEVFEAEVVSDEDAEG